MGDDADWADVKVEDDMPTAQNAPSEAAAAARAILAARKPPPPADDGDSDEEGAAAPQAPQRSSCRHSVAVPPDWQGDRAALDAPSYDGERAKTYPFVLDAFQETSVSVLERNESVLVAAHTSAGKTVVAEYAIAMAFRDNQRVVYTSPLKALSNQKFRELTEEFGDVGLMTGDVCINPNASCIVMTTEVLRGMLYRGSDVVREVKWIIFDEVHYMRDRERGVVWEESIIFAPGGCKFVFLSATLPNAHEFAEWITHLHNHPCHVVYTDYRPTPLQHYGFPKGGNGMVMIVNERKEFMEANYAELEAKIDALTQSAKKRKRDERVKADGGRGRGGGGRGGGGRGGRWGRGGGRGGDSGEDASEVDIKKIMKTIRARDLYPVIVFSFSRRACETHANDLMTGKTQLDFTTQEQKELIRQIYDNALLCMAEEDRELACVQKIYPMLERGIGIHHGGLLPIIKELVEILFGESLVKCLFATETFAMGLNMPARTCVFTEVEKFDGKEMRVLQPGEYTQMAGRAGRRGKDDRGTCILMLDKKLDKEELVHMTCGTGSALMSEFKLTYYSILNLLRRASGEEDAEYVIQRSFHQFQHTREVPRKKLELEEITAEADGIQLDMSDAKAELVRLQNATRDARTALMHHAVDPEKLTRDVLKPGRLVRVRDGDDEWGWGAVVGVRDLPAEAVPPLEPDKASEWGLESEWAKREMRVRRRAIDVLIHCGPGVDSGVLRPAKRILGRPGKLAEKGCTCEIIPVALRLVDAVGAMVLTLPRDLTDATSRAQVGLAINELHHRFQGKAVPELDLENDLRLDGDEFHESMGRWLRSESELRAHPLYAASTKDGGLNEKQIELYRKKASLMERAQDLKKEIKTTQLSKFREELRDRSRVLTRFGMLDEEGTVTHKGRAACEIDTADEVLVTELMFNGCFVAMDHHALVALCSMFMPVEKTNEVYPLAGAAKEALEGPVKQLREAAKAIAEAEIDFGVRTQAAEGEDGRHEAVTEYVDSFKDALVGMVYDWSKGTNFDAIMRGTDMFEGTFVRAARRLDELMMELHRAARAVGSTELADSFEKGAESLRHGVVSAASLYL